MAGYHQGMQLALPAPHGLAAFFGPRRDPKVERQVQEQASDRFELNKPRMAASWGAAMAGSYLAGAAVNAGWQALGLAPTANLGPVGMLIGGGIGAAATYFLTREKLGTVKALGAAALAGVASAAAWSTFGLAGLREGLGMALGGGVGVAIGLKSVPEQNRSLLGTVAAGVLGLGFCHSAGIVGAATGFAVPALAIGLTGTYAALGAGAGNLVARANQRALRRLLSRQIGAAAR